MEAIEPYLLFSLLCIGVLLGIGALTLLTIVIIKAIKESKD